MCKYPQFNYTYFLKLKAYKILPSLQDKTSQRQQSGPSRVFSAKNYIYYIKVSGIPSGNKLIKTI